MSQSDLAARLEKEAVFFENIGKLPDNPEAKQWGADLRAAAQAVRLMGECKKFIVDLSIDMPAKIDERLRYREFQFTDSDIAEIQRIVASIAAWEAAQNG